MRKITFLLPDDTRLSDIGKMAAALGCRLQSIPGDQLIATPPGTNSNPGIINFPLDQRMNIIHR